jgi:hypothetical protein
LFDLRRRTRERGFTSARTRRRRRVRRDIRGLGAMRQMCNGNMVVTSTEGMLAAVGERLSKACRTYKVVGRFRRFSVVGSYRAVV